jgi:hypothetical protein
MKTDPRVFIGSSSEGLPYANAVKRYLDTQGFAASVWNQPGVYIPNFGTMETLLLVSKEYDYAIFVISPDDKIIYRSNAGMVARSNVIYELGLFTGTLGRQRVFSLWCDNRDIFVPSDFHGITIPLYGYSKNHKRPSDYDAATATANGKIVAALQEHAAGFDASTKPPGLLLSVRSAESIGQYLSYRPDNTCSLVVEDEDALARKRLEEACQTAWRETKLNEAIGKALDCPFGLYISMKAKTATHKERFLNYCMRDGGASNDYLLASLIGRSQRYMAVLEQDEEEVNKQKNAHRWLHGQLDPMPLAIISHCRRDVGWSAAILRTHMQRLVYSITTSNENADYSNIKAVFDKIRIPFFDEMMESFENFYQGDSDYMGKIVKTVIHVPILGRPSITVTILIGKEIKVTGAEVCAGTIESEKESDHPVSIEELLAIRLGGEQFMASLDYHYKETGARQLRSL